LPLSAAKIQSKIQALQNARRHDHDWHVYGVVWNTDNTVTAFLDGKKLWQ
jgi:hypothetical protein